ncbi:hypothetical protein TcCL_ESM03014 [Trypanosoma cruzi]|nr:hypothetical protein TcCL_ESM03014 [Trypanosoma cruzi]
MPALQTRYQMQAAWDTPSWLSLPGNVCDPSLQLKQRPPLPQMVATAIRIRIPIRTAITLPSSSIGVILLGCCDLTTTMPEHFGILFRLNSGKKQNSSFQFSQVRVSSLFLSPDYKFSNICICIYYCSMKEMGKQEKISTNNPKGGRGRRRM